MSEKTYLYFLRGGLFLSLLAPLLVFTDLLFPYITSKHLVFNILMELLLVIWAVFILRYPAYRPKKNWISLGLFAYLVAILASCAVSVDFNLSFWGDAERMTSFFHIFHFFIFYLVAITVLRSWRVWGWFLGASVAVAVLVSLFGIFGAQRYSTIGNTAYVSGYLIFNLYFTLLIFWRSRSAWRWLLALPLAVMLWQFFAMHTSGGIIGLATSGLCLVFLAGFFHQRKKVRLGALAVSVLAVLAIVFVFSQQNTAWFKASPLAIFSTQKNTFQTRLISWKGAAADFKHHVMFGTGFGNYAIIFDKHFDPAFFNYMKAETYFDRAHNNLIDITSTTGLVGLLTYLIIFAAALYYLIGLFRRQGGRLGIDEAGRKNWELALVLALLVGYFVQNLVIFDSFTTYVGLMIALAYIVFLDREGREDEEEASAKALKPAWEIWALLIALIIVYVLGLRFNLSFWKTFKGTIAGYSQIMNGDYAGGLDAYRASLQGSAMDRDARNTLVNMSIYNPGLFQYLSPARAGDDLDYVISLAERNVEYNPDDSLNQMQLAQILDTAARYYGDDLAKFNHYSARSVLAIDNSIEASPRRVPVYLVKAQILMARGEVEEALETIDYAISLNPDFSEGYCRKAQFQLLLSDTEKAIEPLDACLARGGAGDINSPQLLKAFITLYASREEYAQAAILNQRLVQLMPDDFESWFNLAKLYAVLGQTEQAQLAASQAIAADPTRASTVREIINVPVAE